ncbi:hypothetical protein SAMN05216456_3055 [Devosia crocina]|uniref:Uncharacterized protein n=1 Tax=Devosia crocina TaxID=429728 RepID=A0A1I7NSX9_9HYPH|nr:hypothetical protein SAMN05216456_3055 [Devosia crocina]
MAKVTLYSSPPRGEVAWPSQVGEGDAATFAETFPSSGAARRLFPEREKNKSLCRSQI